MISKIERLVKRNRNMTRTDLEVELEMQGSYRTLARRVEAVASGMSPELEIACMEARISMMETELLREDGLLARLQARGYQVSVP